MLEDDEREGGGRTFVAELVETAAHDRFCCSYDGILRYITAEPVPCVL